jgi:hypothetical protein
MQVDVLGKPRSDPKTTVERSGSGMAYSRCTGGDDTPID